MMTVSGYLLVPAQDIDAVTDAMPEHVSATLAEPGRLAFSITPDPANPNRFEVHERFIDRGAFDAHQRRTAGAAASANATRQYKLIEE